MQHIMIDLETFGLKPNSVIVALGATLFDPFTTKTIDDIKVEHKFYRNIRAESCIDYGMELDMGTVYWWAKQEKAAGAMINHPKPINLDTALEHFSGFVYDHVIDVDAVRIWSHATFDYVILQNAYEKVGCEWPFKFWNACDIRTLEYVTGMGKPEFEGVPHFALDDACNQAVHVSRMLRQLDDYKDKAKWVYDNSVKADKHGD